VLLYTRGRRVGYSWKITASGKVGQVVEGAEAVTNEYTSARLPDGLENVIAKSAGVSTTQAVHKVLRRLILEGELVEGSVISQLALSQGLSVSRTPLREALRLLEREGLIEETRPNQMVRVSSMSMTDLDDLYSLRVLGEGLALWLSVPVMRQDDFTAMERNLREMDDATNLEDFEDAHAQFHRGLRIGAGLRLRKQLEDLFEHAKRYQRRFRGTDDPNAHELKRQEHHAILDACRDRDRVLGRDLLVDHIASTAIVLMTSERHAPFALPAATNMAKGLSG
jgi:DNA-binding GntR family transcriptional regulator